MVVVDGGVTECVLFQSEVTAMCVCVRARRRMCGFPPCNLSSAALNHRGTGAAGTGSNRLCAAQTSAVRLKPARAGFSGSPGDVTYNHVQTM